LVRGTGGELNPMITCDCLVGRNATKETAWQAVSGVRQMGAAPTAIS